MNESFWPLNCTRLTSKLSFYFFFFQNWPSRRKKNLCPSKSRWELHGPTGEINYEWPLYQLNKGDWAAIRPGCATACDEFRDKYTIRHVSCMGETDGREAFSLRQSINWSCEGSQHGRQVSKKCVFKPDVTGRPTDRLLWRCKDTS